jgi:hypothetical protein
VSTIPIYGNFFKPFFGGKRFFYTLFFFSFFQEKTLIVAPGLKKNKLHLA